MDDWIARDVTQDEQRRPLLGWLVSLLPVPADAEVRVLDIGGGYGLLSAEILDRLPHSTVVLQDFSPPMLAYAAKRLARFGDRVAFAACDLREAGWTDDPGGPFDTVVSSIAIHNVRHPPLIERIYHDIFPLVHPAGGFFNLDLVFPAGSGLAGIYRQATTTGAAVSPQGAHSHHGHHEVVEEDAEPADLDHQLRWLEEAGFAEVDCLWKHLHQTLLCGLRR